MSVAVARDGTIVGYADLGGGEESDGPVWIDLRVRPGHHEAGPLARGTERAQREAARRAATRAESRDARRGRAADEALLGAGFSRLRGGYRMEIDANGAIGPPVWPDGLVVRPAAAEEEGERTTRTSTRSSAHPTLRRFRSSSGDSGCSTRTRTRRSRSSPRRGRRSRASRFCARGRGGDAELGWIHVIGVRPRCVGAGSGARSSSTRSPSCEPEARARRPRRRRRQRAAIRPLRERRDAHRASQRLREAAVTPRWATFDCYGTLVDWDGGIGDELARLSVRGRRRQLLAATTSSSRSSSGTGRCRTAR